MNFLVEDGRVKLANEFLAAMVDPSAANFGVLFSGPNGIGELFRCARHLRPCGVLCGCIRHSTRPSADLMRAYAPPAPPPTVLPARTTTTCHAALTPFAGKSAIGVLCFLACLARGLLIVSIPRAANWVAAAADGRGAAFFLDVMLSQNAGECAASLRFVAASPRSVAALLVSSAVLLLPPRVSLLADIIQSNPDLMAVFEPLFKRKDELGEKLDQPGQAARELGPQTMLDLTALLRRRPDLRVGVVVDETQNITEAAESSKSTDAAARAFFRDGWYGWQQGAGTSFVRMDIASSHGA